MTSIKLSWFFFNSWTTYQCLHLQPAPAWRWACLLLWPSWESNQNICNYSDKVSTLGIQSKKAKWMIDKEKLITPCCATQQPLRRGFSSDKTSWDQIYPIRRESYSTVDQMQIDRDQMFWITGEELRFQQIYCILNQSLHRTIQIHTTDKELSCLRISALCFGYTSIISPHYMDSFLWFELVVEWAGI